jgi:uncharacterized protein (DUF1330 family)
MPAYVIAQMQVNDPEMYREYAAKFAPTVEPYGGKVLAANDADVREGDPPYPRFVVGEFPTIEAARSWYESEAYQAVIGLRLNATDGMLVMVEGITMPTEPHPPSSS